MNTMQRITHNLLATVAALLATFDFVVKGADSKPTVATLKLAALPVTYDGSFVTSLNYSRVMAMAIEDVVADNNLLPDHELQLQTYGPNCGQSVLIEDLVEEALSDGADVIISPKGTISGTSIADMTSARGVALIDSFRYIVAVSREEHTRELPAYPSTMTSVISDYLNIVYSIHSTIVVNGWKHVLICQTNVHEDDGFDIMRLSSNLETLLLQSGIIVENKEIFSAVEGYQSYKRALRRLAKYGRVILLLSYVHETPDALLVAYDLGFFKTSEYVFLTLDMGPTSLIQWMWKSNPESNKKLDVAYKSCLLFTRVPHNVMAKYNSFRRRMQVQLLEPQYQSRVNEVEKVAGYVYDAVMFYARVADSMVRDGLDPKDGFNFTVRSRMVNFMGLTGSVSVNAQGERNDDYSVQDYDNFTFTTAAVYDGFNKKYIPLRPIQWGPYDLSTPPSDSLVCGFEGEKCKQVDPTAIITGTVSSIILLAFLVGITILYKKNQFESQLYGANWKIELSELQFTKEHMNETVYIKRISKFSVDYKNRSILLEFKIARDMHHENVNAFIGACVVPGHLMVVSRLCGRGGLDDVLQNHEIQLDLTFQVSISMDIINGLKFISKSLLGFHGNLSSKTCLVDSRWTVKLSGVGLREFTKPDKEEDDPNLVARGLLWTAPEHLRDDGGGSVRGDIYSFGIILQEVALRAPPYSEVTHLSPKEIIGQVRDLDGPTFRPPIPANSCERHLEVLMRKCWDENPLNRPEFAAISQDFRKLNGGNYIKRFILRTFPVPLVPRTVNIMDNMVLMLEKHATNLETIVAERTVQLLEEKKKTDMLLNQMLPESVAVQLKAGNRVHPESFDQVTIFFSDIVGFTALSSESTPIQVVNLLNDLYTLFDGILNEYDVYKVETIGDAYMVVSGLPIRNGHKHAGHICTVSLHLLSSIISFRIQHRPNRKLKLRVGIHSGPCVSGVVGLKMPRYCLFGDTVNTASRMESNGKALRVHISADTQRWLKDLGGYTVVERGQVDMKGKGIQTTYWLEGKVGFSMPLPDWTTFDD